MGGGSCWHVPSPEYGLLPSEKVIKPYDGVVGGEKAKYPAPEAVKTIRGHDAVTFFQAGARSSYRQRMEDACKMAGTESDPFGSSFMEDMDKPEEKLGC